MIHFNTAGAGLPSLRTIEAIQAFLEAEREAGAYETELGQTQLLDHELYANIARLLGTQPEDIALFDSATKAWVTALEALEWREGDRVLITPYEYAGNLIALKSLQTRYGLVIEVMPLLADGDLDLTWLAETLDERVKLVSVVHVPSCCGIVNDIVSVGRLLRHHRTTYFVDACQSVGMLAVDVQQVGCDVLTCAGRKFLCGPRGTGIAYLSAAFRARARPRFTDLHRATVDRHGVAQMHTLDARCYEYAERNGALLAGLNNAVMERLLGGYVDDCEAYRALVQALGQRHSLKLISPGSQQRGIVSFVHARMEAPDIVQRLRDREINCWAAYSSHTPYYMPARAPERFVRVSLGAGSTLEQVDRFLQHLDSLD